MTILQMKAGEGDQMGAVHLLLKANRPVQAFNMAIATPELANQESLMQNIAVSLLKNHIFDKVC